MSSPLRIGIVIADTGEFTAWESEMLGQLLSTGLAKNFLFISVPPKKNDSKFLYGLFKRFEDNWFRSIPNAFKAVPIKELYSAAEIISSSAVKKGIVDLLYISCWADDKFIPEIHPTYGKWFLTFGSGQYKNAQPSGFWEVMNDEVVIGSSLSVQLPSYSNTVTVYSGNTTTVPYSVKNTLNTLAWKSASFIGYRLKELQMLGNEAFFNKYQQLQKNKATHPISNFKTPGNFKMAFLFIGNIFKYLRYKLSGENKGRFTLLYSNEEFSPDNINLSVFKSIPLPEGVFYADPFVVANKVTNYIFFEEYIYTKDKAHISVLTIDNKGNCSTPVTVLDQSYHLSYPFVFEWEDQFYMIPETSANKTVELYRAAKFPYQWEFVMNLMEDISLLDVTLVYENKTWWLFGNAANISFTSTNDQLLLYYSKDLCSKNWTPHPQNPIATNIANCRPAGKLFRRNGQLYRPAQNNASRQYGFGLCINKIVTLNETEYYEEEISSIIPGEQNNLKAIHTINFTDSITVIDAILK